MESPEQYIEKSAITDTRTQHERAIDRNITTVLPNIDIGNKIKMRIQSSLTRVSIHLRTGATAAALSISCSSTRSF